MGRRFGPPLICAFLVPLVPMNHLSPLRFGCFIRQHARSDGYSVWGLILSVPALRRLRGKDGTRLGVISCGLIGGTSSTSPILRAAWRGNVLDTPNAKRQTEFHLQVQPTCPGWTDMHSNSFCVPPIPSLPSPLRGTRFRIFQLQRPSTRVVPVRTRPRCGDHGLLPREVRRRQARACPRFISRRLVPFVSF